MIETIWDISSEYGTVRPVAAVAFLLGQFSYSPRRLPCALRQFVASD